MSKTWTNISNFKKCSVQTSITKVKEKIYYIKRRHLRQKLLKHNIIQKINKHFLFYKFSVHSFFTLHYVVHLLYVSNYVYVTYYIFMSGWKVNIKNLLFLPYIKVNNKKIPFCISLITFSVINIFSWNFMGHRYVYVRITCEVSIQ